MKRSDYDTPHSACGLKCGASDERVTTPAGVAGRINNKKKEVNMKNHEEDCPCHMCELEREDKERMELEESNERDILD